MSIILGVLEVDKNHKVSYKHMLFYIMGREQTLQLFLTPYPRLDGLHIVSGPIHEVIPKQTDSPENGDLGDICEKIIF